MHADGHLDSATLRGARVVGIAGAVLFFVLIPLSLAFPSAFLFPPYHPVYERFSVALLFTLGVSLLLALRDPGRNAGVYAVIGFISGSLAAAIVYTLATGDAGRLAGGDLGHWAMQIPLLGLAAVALVATYTRLRRPHPVVVRIVVAAVVLLPLGLYLYDRAYVAFVVVPR